MTKQLVATALLLLVSISSAYAVSLPGIPESGPLNFEFTDAVTPPTSMNDLIRKWNANRVTVSAPLPGLTQIDAVNIGNFTFTDLDWTQHQGTNGRFQLSAVFDSTGTLVGGTVSIVGQVSGIGINTVQTLMTAELSGFAREGNLIGFATTNVWCNAAYAADCFQNESVYLNVQYNETDVNTDGLINGQFLASSLTTVPVPASVWLLGSALGLMGATMRRRKNAAV